VRYTRQEGVSSKRGAAEDFERAMRILDLIDKESEVSTLMGIDISTTSLAFSFYRDLRLSKWGKIYIEGDDSYSRSADAYNKFNALCRSASPSMVVAESSIYVNNNNVMKQLSMILGCVSASAVNAGSIVKEVPPITWQSYIGNKNYTKQEKEKFLSDNPDASPSKIKQIMREERKHRTISFAKERFDVTVEDNDVADAIAIGFYGIENFAGGK
jgi:Holliday junction resolvasome RuvABC endonuclease subunit